MRREYMVGDILVSRGTHATAYMIVKEIPSGAPGLHRHWELNAVAAKGPSGTWQSLACGSAGEATTKKLGRRTEYPDPITRSLILGVLEASARKDAEPPPEAEKTAPDDGAGLEVGEEGYVAKARRFMLDNTHHILRLLAVDEGSDMRQLHAHLRKEALAADLLIPETKLVPRI